MCRSTSRRYNLLPGSFVPSSSVIRPELLIPRPFASSPLPSRSSSYFGPTTTADLTTLSSVSRFPVLVQIHHDPTGSHQPPYFWKTATTGRFHPQHLPGDPTPPPWVCLPKTRVTFNNYSHFSATQRNYVHVHKTCVHYLINTLYYYLCRRLRGYEII